MLTCFFPFSLLDFDFVPFFCSISFILDLTLLFVYVFLLIYYLDLSISTVNILILLCHTRWFVSKAYASVLLWFVLRSLCLLVILTLIVMIFVHNGKLVVRSHWQISFFFFKCEELHLIKRLVSINLGSLSANFSVMANIKIT